MKTKRTIASILAAVMAFSALPILSASAADTAALGDVDGDGTVTMEDGRFLLKAYSYRLAGSDFYPAEGCYVLQ